MFLDILKWLFENLRWSSQAEADEAYRSLATGEGGRVAHLTEEEREAVKQVILEQRRGELISGIPFI